MSNGSPELPGYPGLGEGDFTVDVRSFPEKPKGLGRFIPTQLRAKITSTHVAYGSPHMTKEEAQKAVPGTVESVRQEDAVHSRSNGGVTKRFFGRVVEDKGI